MPAGGALLPGQQVPFPVVEERETAAAGTAGAPEPAAQNDTKTTPRRRLSGRAGRTVRGLMMLMYVALTWPLVIDPNRDGAFPQNLVTGVLVATVVLMVLAAIALPLRRRRRRKNPHSGRGTAPTFANTVTSVPVVLLAFVLASVSAAGRQIDLQQKRSQLATSDAVSSNPVDRDRGALAAWLQDLPVGQQDKALGIKQLALMLRELGGANPNLTSLVAQAKTARAAAARFLADVDAEPAATADVQAVKALHRQEASLFLAATDAYLRGLSTRDQKLLDHGDALMQQSDAAARQSVSHGEALYARLGGASAFQSRVDFQALAAGIGQARQNTRP